jgi:hypothetical protein
MQSIQKQVENMEKVIAFHLTEKRQELIESKGFMPLTNY